MSWEQTLGTLLDLSIPISNAVASGEISNFESGWDSPAIKQARDKLVAELTSKGKIEELLEVGKELREQHRQLMAKDELTPTEIKKLGVLSATAFALSAEALAQAVTGKAIFLYTMRCLVPWLRRLSDVAIMIANTHSRDLDAPTQDPARDGGAVDAPIAAPVDTVRLRRLRLLEDLAATTRMLASLTERLT